MSFIQCNKVEDPGGLFLPKGFVSTVYVDGIEEKVRHMIVNDKGDLYVKLRRQGEDGAIAAIRDANKDGVMDSLIKFGSYHMTQRGSYSTGIAIYKDYLYFSSELTVYRYKLDPDKLV
ncbi:MAG: cytochrome C, partial [Flavobacteriaceae bacterium]|nr:cytochrome C [Flavobacteriaceae bacterium]